MRRAAGHQAALLNQIIAELFKDRHVSHGKLKEPLGHTPQAVFAGMAVGRAVAFAVQMCSGGWPV